jgi:multisubunit Na+/H+ antiporter MnhC subunit
MMLVSLFIPILVEIGVFMLVVDLLNLLFTSFHILAHGYLLVISLWSLSEDSLLLL